MSEPKTPWQKFHWLWSRDVGKEGYNKEHWKELEKFIPGPAEDQPRRDDRW